MTPQLLGVDLSGSAEEWKARRRNSSVWIATAHADAERLVVDDLRPVQALDGEGEPFERLIALLRRTEGFAAIDAPFGVPRAHAASQAVLWAQVVALPQGRRPFGRGADFLRLLAPEAGRYGLKSYRQTEEVWLRRRLNVRPTLWGALGGGAAVTAACLTLLQRSGAPVWPLRQTGAGAVLVEAWPAAQLAAWGLQASGYSGTKPKPAAARERILAALIVAHGLRIPDRLSELCRRSADALDAVICAYAAKTLAEGRHPRQLPAAARSEGWIVVDETAAAGAAPLLGAAAEHRARRHLDALAALVADDTQSDSAV